MTVRAAAVILAAGLSARMGDRPKLLLDVGGAPMIRRTAENVLAFEPVETLVVTGHRSEEIEAALEGLPVRFVHNPRYAEGQPTSVAAGVSALATPCDAVMVVLGDQPLVTAPHLRSLVSAFCERGEASILVPFHAGQRGNPVVIEARHIPAMMGGEVNLGCRRLIETHPDEVCTVDMGTDVFTFDCDTPEDYERLLGRV